MRENAFLTPEKARELGLAFDDPKPMRCRWCGKELTPLGAEFLGRVRWVTAEFCGCEGERIEQERIEREERRSKEAEVARKLAAAGVARRFAGARTSIPEVARLLAEFDPHGGDGLFIHGRVGSGKTHAASALARALVYAGASVVMTTTLDMLDSIQATYGHGASTAGGVGRYTGCDLLILDDLGKEYGNSWVLTTIFQVVNVRYEDMRPIGVTSQYAPAALARRLGRAGERESAEAIASRLAEMCTPVPLPDLDHRRRRQGTRT